MASGAFAKLYAKWFESPIPPHAENLNFSMSDALKERVAHPSDPEQRGATVIDVEVLVADRYDEVAPREHVGHHRPSDAATRRSSASRNAGLSPRGRTSTKPWVAPLSQPEPATKSRRTMWL